MMFKLNVRMDKQAMEKDGVPEDQAELLQEYAGMLNKEVRAIPRGNIGGLFFKYALLRLVGHEHTFHVGSTLKTLERCANDVS